MNTTPRHIIRQAGISDVEQLAGLCRRTFHETYEAFNTAEDLKKYMDSCFSEEMIRAELEDAGTVIYVSADGPVFTGYISLKNKPLPSVEHHLKCLEIARFYVDKQYQGKKVGRELMEQCFDFAAQNGFELIWLSAWQKNLRSLEIYRHLGFKISGTTTFTLGDDVQDDFIMTKLL